MGSVDYNNMRRAMVDSQLRTSGVAAPWVITAMGEVAREDFVPDAYRTTAYMDRAVVLSNGRVLNPPVATALMLQAADVSIDDKILLIGLPGGYVATLLSTHNKNVVAIETLADLPDTLFSLILIDGAVEELPEALLNVAQDGARIVTGIVERGVTRLASGYVRGGKVALRPFSDTEIASLPGFASAWEFVF
jgi:protein-L-isoaspartate(D-aspartate) O-methyltransferase